MKRLALGAILVASLFGPVAHAAPAKCAAMYKDIQTLEVDVKKLQAQQVALEEAFREADDARASARAELDNMSIGASARDSAKLIQVSHDEADADAVQARADLEEVNAAVIEKGAKRKAAVEAFNKTCLD